MAYNENYPVRAKHLVSLATKTKSVIEAAIADLPVEMFLDNTKTAFVGSFAFDATTYAGATNPNLDGKPVLVLAVKGVDNKTKAETTTYSFLDMQTLVNIYTAKSGASAQILNIAGYEIEVVFDSTLTSSANGLGVAVSTAANNAITKQADGLHVDISSKADQDTDAVEGNIAVFDANGNPVDSGVTFATDAEVEEALNTALGISNS